MTLEERLAVMEQELATLRGKPVVYASGAYGVASQNCKAHFEAVKLGDQHYRAQTACEAAARDAYKERHGVTGKDGRAPARYIRTEEEGEEYFELFKGFLGVYQSYLSN